jgi:hypothetical protein
MERVKSEIENNILKSPSRQQKLMITSYHEYRQEQNWNDWYQSDF